MAQPQTLILRERADELVRMVRRQIQASQDACALTKRIIEISRQNQVDGTDGDGQNRDVRR